MQYRYMRSWKRFLSGATLVFLALLCVMSGGFETAYAKDQNDDPATILTNYVEITLAPDTQQIAPDGTVTYSVHVRSRKSDTDVSGVQVTLHYAEDQLTPSTTAFDSSKDWVSKIKDGYLTINFDTFKDRDGRTARISFRVNPQLASGTNIDMRAAYKVGTPRDDSDDTLRAATVTVFDAATASAGTVTNAAVSQNGSTYQFYGNHFAANEPVVTWLNTPNGGVQSLALTSQTNANGEVWFNLDGTNLTHGAYSFVMFGRSSGQTSVAAFIVQ